MLLIAFFLILLWIAFPAIGKPVLFALFAIFYLYTELFWFLLRLPIRLIRGAFRLAHHHPQQP